MSTKPVQSFAIEPKYRKDNGQYLQDIDRTDLPLGFEPVERSLVVIPPGQVGGNHIHSRLEGFIGIGPGLQFCWEDENGMVQSEPMNPGGELRLVVVDSLVPHAVKNEGSEQAVLLEYASQTQQDSSYERHEVVDADAA